MRHTDDPEYDARGLSTSQVIVMFLAGVAVCAVFFSAGFLVGYNERTSKATPITERVSGSPDIPPVASQESSGPSSEPERMSPPEQPASTSAVRPAPLRPQQAASAANQPSAAETKPGARTPQTSALPHDEAASKPSGASSMPSTIPATADNGASFIIQVAATSTRPDAEKLVAALKSLNYSVNLVTPEQAHAGDNLFRVQVGPFATRDSAEKARTKLMLDGFKQPFIKH